MAKHVIFGTGPLGLAVMQALINDGETSIRMINRSGSANVPDSIEVVKADAYNTEHTKQVTLGAEVIYQCAQPAYQDWQARFPSLQASILAAATHNTAKLVLGDNLYLYGDTNGHPIHEGLPAKPHTKKGKVRAQMAQTALDAHQAGKVQVTIGRASDFYGEAVRQSALGERVFANILAGKAAQFVGDPDQPHTHTYIQDFGKGLVILGHEEKALGRAWIVPSPPTHTSRELMQLIADQAKKPLKVSAMGRTMTRAVGLFMPPVRELVEMLYEFEKPFIVDHSQFEAAFGDIATPHNVAIANTIKWYQQNRS